MKISAIIVCFDPDYKLLEKNISSVVQYVDILILWQNTIVENFTRSFLDPSVYHKVLYLGDGTNVGIAKALNEGVIWSKDRGYTHILTLDQDSYFETSHLQRYRNYIYSKYIYKEAIFGVNPRSEDRLLFTSASPLLEVSDTITSGSIFPLVLFEKYGLFKECLFIDAVDYEFCYRVKTIAGIKTYVFPDIILYHKVGYVTKTRWGFKTDNYSAFRTFYIVRNHIIVWRQYPGLFPKLYKRTLLRNHILYRIIKVILGESDKVNKIKAIISGCIHGLIDKV